MESKTKFLAINKLNKISSNTSCPRLTKGTHLTVQDSFTSNIVQLFKALLKVLTIRQFLIMLRISLN